MENFEKNLDNMISKILKEEIETKSKTILERLEEGGEWTEIEVDEALHGGQKKLDKNKNGKIDAEDFKLLRKKKSHKKEMDEFFFEDEAIEDAEEASQQEPTYVGKGLEEAETEEGNAFTGALADAKKEGKKTFKVGEKTFDVKEERHDFDGRKSEVIGVYSNIDKQRKEMGEKWEGDVEVKQTGEYSGMSIEELNAAIKKLKTKNDKAKDAGKKVPHADRTKMSQLYFAKRAKQGWKGKGKAAVKESLQLSEEELIDLIETIVMEQKVKDIAEKNNITNKKAEGLKKTEKVLKADKKENDDYAKEVVKKMKEYVKAGSVGEYNESPESFPQSNYTMGKMKEKTMKYHPSQAVDEYIEAFAFPGMTNLVYDEIKPDEKKIEKHLKGDSTTGNAVKDKDGTALGNVVPSEVGERFMKNFEDNLYGAEQMNVSYKRQPQPVDVGGTDKMDGSLKSIRKGSTKKAEKIMNQLESSEDRKDEIIKEEMNKMMNLITYNKKTQ
jgi:uncharacterized protein YukE